MGTVSTLSPNQAASNFARDHQMTCFFPSGTYKTSDTLSCIQGYYRRRHGKVSAAAPLRKNPLRVILLPICLFIPMGSDDDSDRSI